MADNNKYYYIRLKEGFFDTNEILMLESMPDGYLYSNILLKLYLRSLKTNGKLMFNDNIPYNPQMIATITRHQVGTVEKALKIFEQIGLIEVLDNGAIYMLDIQNYIGKSSTEADRIRIYRESIKNEKQLLNDNSSTNVITNEMTNVQQMNDKCNYKSTPDIEIEKELKIDTEKDIYINNNTCNSQDAVKHASDTKKSEEAERLREFEIIYKIYPKKRGNKQNAFKTYKQWVGKGRRIDGHTIKLTREQIYYAVKNYVNQQEEDGTELQYYKNFDTLMNNINGYVVEENKDAE